MAQVVQLAKLRGWLVYHTFDSRRSASGFPDLVLIRCRSIIVAELKVGKNRLTAAQQDWLDKFRGCGIPAYEWTPERWREIESVLELG